MPLLHPLRACAFVPGSSINPFRQLSRSLIPSTFRPPHQHHHPFTSTSARPLRTTELQPSHFPSLKCQPSRLWSDIHSTAIHGPGRRYGDLPEQTGLSRLALTDSDSHARSWFVETTKSLGCTVTVDGIGNVFAIRPGLNNDVPPTFVGSHLDSQPLGGRFDGVLGVCAGIEMLRVLNDNWIETEGPVGVVNWTNEEGARFPVSMMGSGVWGGNRGLQATYDLEEVGGGGGDGSRHTVREELERIGYLGIVPARVEDGGMRMAGHFELHIEQGPRLLAMGKRVAAVTGVQAYKWFEVHVYGRACHSGTTPMRLRADPLAYAAGMIFQTNRMARMSGVLLSVGIMRAEPGSVNTVPDHVMFTMDIRAETDEELREFEETFMTQTKAALTKRNDTAKKDGAADEVSLEIRETFHSPAMEFDEIAVGLVEEAARDVLQTGDGEGEVPRMISGAGHDSVNTARHCPTAMVFVPCKDGVSHEPREWCEEADCAVGTDVVIQSVLRFDKWRHEQGHFAG